jgi:F-type H+-transporting ATPase subunit b
MNSLLSLFSATPGGPLTYETHHWLLPETAEIIYGGLASVLVIGALAKFAGPMIKKSLAARTERIQADMDNARTTRETAEVAVLSEGRARVQAEMVEVEAKAMSDIANAAGRVGDELRAEISRLSAVAIERVVANTVTDSVRQDLIEGFISKVGASR